MDNEKIQNEKTEVPSTIEMNDKDYLTDILETEKNMSVDMVYSLNEASNEKLYQELLVIFQKIKQTQRKIYELMFKNGWYSLEKAPEQKMTESYNKHQKCFKELNY